MKSDTLDWTPGQLYAYTDGATFRAQPGPMSWAVVFVRDGKIELLETEDGLQERVYASAAQHGSNNRAELMGILWALREEQTEDLIIVSDAEPIIKAAQGTFRRRSLLHLWQQFEMALNVRTRRGLRTEFHYVRGHSDDRFNREADRRAAQPALANYVFTRKGLQCANNDDSRGATEHGPDRDDRQNHPRAEAEP